LDRAAIARSLPSERATEFLLLDHDSKYGTEVPVAIRSMDIKAVRTAVGCPWQNGVAERWVGSCRRNITSGVFIEPPRSTPLLIVAN